MSDLVYRLSRLAKSLNDDGDHRSELVQAAADEIERLKEVARTPGPATAKMVERIAADVKYEEERVAKMGSVLEDEDEENTWYTIGEARAFLAEHEPHS